MRLILVVCGSLCVVLGVIGMLLPLMPTTPFLLLSAVCYAKSSDRFYRWLMNHKWFGPIINQFRSREGVPQRIKIRAIVTMWLCMGVSATFLWNQIVALIILVVCGVGVTIFLWHLPTAKETP